MAGRGGVRSRRATARARTQIARVALGLALLLAAALARADDAGLVERLLAARANARTLALPAGLGVERGYAVQMQLTERLLAGGARIAGYKAAFTTEAGQRAMGIAGPAYAPLFAAMQVASGAAIQRADYAALRAEVEVAFRLRSELRAPFDPAALRDAVASLHVALELPDLRVEGWPDAGALIADGVGARHFALGPAHAAHGIDAASLTCELVVDSVRFTQGPSSAALGDPWKALAWLAGEHLRRGGKLAVGDVILTGALGEVWAAGPTPPREFIGRCEQLGEVRIRVE